MAGWGRKVGGLRAEGRLAWRWNEKYKEAIAPGAQQVKTGTQGSKARPWKDSARTGG